MRTKTRFLLGSKPLTLTDLNRIARNKLPIELAPEVRARVQASRDYVEKKMALDEVIYGLNTGFGKLSTVRISPDETEELQRNLLRSHASGVGEPLPEVAVRALVVLRVNSLLGGYSGVRYELLESLVAMVNNGVIPFVPCRGSVGASGDLAPLAHVALTLMGEGEAFWKGERMPSADALGKAGLKPFTFCAKEALAAINGTQLMCAVGGLALARAANLLKAADVVCAMSVEALMGTDKAFHEAIHKIRPHPGQMASAANLRRCLGQSELVRSHKDCPRVQDAYSLRCAPQVHGAAREGYNWARSLLEREMNSVTDNPLIFPERDLVLSGGNFHGAPVALALDCSAIALSYLGTISERRCDRLLNPELIVGDLKGHPPNLPAFLAPGVGLNSGLMLVQYVSAALASENKILCHPASADTIPTSAGHEDHVSMGPAAAYKLEKLLDHLEQILACEWMCAAQALEYRRPLHFGPGTEAAYKLLRTRVAALDGDRALYGDLAVAKSLLADGELVSIVEANLGGLE